MVERTRHVGRRIADHWQLKRRASAPASASGSEDVSGTAHEFVLGRVPRWAGDRPTTKGMRRHPRLTKSAPAALDKPPLIDGFVRADFGVAGSSGRSFRTRIPHELLCLIGWWRGAVGWIIETRWYEFPLPGAVVRVARRRRCSWWTAHEGDSPSWALITSSTARRVSTALGEPAHSPKRGLSFAACVRSAHGPPPRTVPDSD